MVISIPELYDRFRECAGVSTDTRKITEGCLYVALKGEKFDGNLFANDALEKGARYALVDTPELATDSRYLLVDDGLTALQELARYHRNTLTIPVIGLTGSNGKTTTKELIASVVSRKYRTYATQGNLNNHIGVPLTLLAIDAAYEMAVVEMGANHQGEIRLLCSIAQPTHGMITNVGKAHLEGFGGVEGVRKGKGELFDFLAETGGTVFINAHSPVLMEMAAERLFREAVFYQLTGQYEILSDNPVVYKDEVGQVITTHLPGRYNFDNMAAALCIGKFFGVPAEEANEAVAGYNPTNNRSQFIRKGSNTILMDAYNANPSSMAAAIQHFMKQDAAHKVVILGDMYELGPESPAEHAALGELIAQGKFDTVILAGQDMRYALSALPKAYYFPDKFSLHNWIMDNPFQDTAILIKGSRGMGLESVVQFL
ncbi:UDP-N-acetylmuramoyl-tripeptide--D-alanyl-D-alanine ligase [Larkinella humicola]|uniref:UDP-N-acetylmuramoyl-tripeptide--D-alanyl-D-alanine ligase n=1 Tax=Larkinella humicola TaxID=2607654 RepID=A0A5N1JHI0_9BACT|nr:UDP-N-acetylmuramoyl-tripeptide--D-alanyl-D-alanine ligase [Larkinella humicola]KAA9354855.1 UDP-N-acetylmuramoyl-tripeptide--D-alanyl-D-alanine ligase [Larkinella humicola]